MVKRVNKKGPEDYIKFLGTAGARFVMIRQLRASGGMWISCSGTNVLLDPGPGSLVRCTLARPRLDPGLLDAVIVTHRHLDHSSDINVIIEAMTAGGFKKRGIIFCPQDALTKDSIILDYAAQLPERIVALAPGRAYRAGDFRFRTSMPHLHPVETYGLKFSLNGTSVGLLTDTRYFPGLRKFYKTDVLIISVVFLEARPEVAHLCLSDAAAIIRDLRPQKVILTHFGMSMLKADPNLQAKILARRLGINVQAAYDGMTLQF